MWYPNRGQWWGLWLTAIALCLLLLLMAGEGAGSPAPLLIIALIIGGLIVWQRAKGSHPTEADEDSAGQDYRQNWQIAKPFEGATRTESNTQDATGKPSVPTAGNSMLYGRKYCTECGCGLTDPAWKHCPNCGQAVRATSAE